MRRSSKIALAVCGVLLAYLGALYLYYMHESRPEMNEQDARTMLDRLASAFERASVSDVLSFAAPDAKVAGRDLEEIRRLLQLAFRNIRNPHVEFRDLHFTRNGETAHLGFSTTVVDREGSSGGNVLYAQPMGFVVKRIAIPQLGGLFTTYVWKVTDVEAPHLPDASGL